MARFWVLGLAAVVLPACHEHTVWVNNEGGSDARVDVHYTTEDEDDDGSVVWTKHHYDSWVVPPQQILQRTYPPEILDVRISRDGDDATLFRETLTPGDFRDEHSRIEITVIP